jgi:hypothetical protein
MARPVPTPCICEMQLPVCQRRCPGEQTGVETLDAAFELSVRVGRRQRR